MSALEVGTGAMEWCNKCLTTSALTVDLLHVHDGGVSVAGFVRRCFACDPRDPGSPYAYLLSSR